MKMIGGSRREGGRESEWGGQKASCLRDKFKKHDLLNTESGGIRDWTAPQSTYRSLLILEHINSCNYTATTD